MHTNTIVKGKPIKARKLRIRQKAWSIILLLPFILFILSSCTIDPNVSQSQKPATNITSTATPQQRSTLHPASTANHGCSDIVYLDRVSWQEIRIYFNDCALQYLTAIVDSADVSTAFVGFDSLWCPECAPLAAGLAVVAAGITANIANLQYAAQRCGSAYLDISWQGGWRFESACDTPNNGS